MTLLNLPIGKTGCVISLKSKGGLRRRLLDIGLTPGTEVTHLYQSPFRDPSAYGIRGAVMALRSEDAALIEITKIGRDDGGTDDTVNRS